MKSKSCFRLPGICRTSPGDQGNVKSPQVGASWYQFDISHLLPCLEYTGFQRENACCFPLHPGLKAVRFLRGSVSTHAVPRSLGCNGNLRRAYIICVRTFCIANTTTGMRSDLSSNDWYCLYYWLFCSRLLVATQSIPYVEARML